MGATIELTDTDASASDIEEKPEELEREVEGIRENITDIVGELDRRRHDLLDWRLQLRKHAAVLAAVTAGWVLALAITTAFRASRHRRQNRPLAKARRLVAALSRLVAHPERVAQPLPGIGRKVLGAAASASVSVLTKAALNELLASLVSDEASIRVTRS
jgi:hypothetical protein